MGVQTHLLTGSSPICQIPLWLLTALSAMPKGTCFVTTSHLVFVISHLLNKQKIIIKINQKVEYAQNGPSFYFNLHFPPYCWDWMLLLIKRVIFLDGLLVGNDARCLYFCNSFCLGNKLLLLVTDGRCAPGSCGPPPAVVSIGLC